MCERCPLREPRLDYALAYNVYGTWGGTSRGEREEVRRELGISPLPVLIHNDLETQARPQRRSTPHRTRAPRPKPAPVVEQLPAAPEPAPEPDVPPVPELVIEQPAPAPEPPAADVKHCPRCRTDRARTDYYANRANPDRLAVWCKPCFRERGSLA
ncbi:hypothetical protein Psi01_26090 [Planobispora siamensis]|uniref:4Fe-4S Wbl-type domain-containing protein n=1 Tax=Planobispora siamensis TaxID=936338 RepID=A0A8J3SER8_9ACTN|nr:hypothetical protein Psi01_26090 [Planobispora siamensis]